MTGSRRAALAWWGGAAGAAVVGLLVALRPARVAWFQSDDFFNFSVAQRGLTWEMLKLPVFEHFLPGHRLSDYLLDRFAPMDWTAARLVGATLVLTSALLLFAIMRRISAPSPWHLVLVLTFAGSLANARVLQWWAAAVQNLPSTTLTLAAMLLWIVHVQTRRWIALAGAVAAFLAGLAFYEKPLLLLGYLPLLLVLVIEPPGGVRAAVRALLRAWPSWVAFGVPALAYLVWYRHNGYGGHPTPPPLSQLFTYARILWLRGFGPSLVGVRVLTTATPAQELGIVAGQATLILLVAWTIARRPAVAIRAWLFFAVTFFVNALGPGLARITQFGVAIGFDARYWTEYAFLLPIAASVALAGRRDGLADAPWRALRSSVQRIPAAAGVAVALLLSVGYVAVARHGVMLVGELGPPAKGKQIVATMRRSIAGLRAQGIAPVIQDDQVVDEVLTAAFLAPYNRWWYVVPVLHLGVPVATPGAPQYWVDGTGRLMPARWTTAFAARSGAAGATLVATAPSRVAGASCGTGVNDGSAIELRPPRPLSAPTGVTLRLRLTAIARHAGELTSFVDTGGGYSPAPLPVFPYRAGRSTTVTALPGTITGVRLGIPIGTTICPLAVEIGRVPAS